MKKPLLPKKVIRVMELVFGWGIALCLFAGGLTFFGYLAALVIGGDAAAAICDFIYNILFKKALVPLSSVLVLFGLVKMYLCNETALSGAKKKSVKHTKTQEDIR